MRTNQETIHHGDKPEPAQLSSLAAQLILFAQRNDALSVKDDGRRQLRRYSVGKSVQYECPTVLDGSPYGYMIEHSMGAVAMRYADLNAWKLWVYDRFETTSLGSQRGGSRTVYGFEWTPDMVTRATRKSAATPERRPGELIDVVDNLSMPDDPGWEPSMLLRTTYMDHADTEYLSGQLGRYIQQVDSGALPYRDTRNNYLDYFAK